MRDRSRVGLGAALVLCLVSLAVVVGRANSSPRQVSPVEPVASPVLKVMSVFSRPAVIDTRPYASEISRVASALTRDESGVPEQWKPGSAEFNRVRVLLTGLGASNRTILAFPTSKERVCSTLTGFSAGCLDGFRSGRGVVSATVGAPNAYEGTIVWGLAPDNVQRVEVVTQNQMQRATLGNNAYFYQALTRGSTPDSLVVTFKDGSTQTVRLSRPARQSHP